MERILMLIPADCYADAAPALASAKDNAFSPQRISYGIVLQEEPQEEDLAAMRALGSVLFLAPADDPWSSFPALWQGEGYVLLSHPAMRFTRHWDMHLLNALHACHSDSDWQCVLTGFPPTPDDPVDAVSPVAAESFDASGCLCFHKGTPLRYAKAPETSAFLNPAFCFGPAAFFTAMAEETFPRFLAAFRDKWALFTLHKPLIHMAWNTLIAPCPVPTEEGRASGLARFQLKFPMKLEEHKLSGMARTGIFSPDLSFPTHVPLAVRLQESWHTAAERKSHLSPLFITAYVSLPEPGERLPEEDFCRFGRLSQMRNLALLCFADSAMSRRLMPMLPNVLEYKSRYGLPLPIENQQEEASKLFALSKMFLLAQGREKFLSHSHYGWIDFGYLGYPVYERASLSWESLCTDQIVLATVNGKVDLSMIIVPEEHLNDLCAEILRRCRETYQSLHTLPEEGQLWQDMLHDLPDWFEPVELPRRNGLLELAMLNRSEEFHTQ